ncbi:hypothetical protein, partial [Micrococcus luteus]|uniref:hypothetical protein n=1 Tax=Micrococcus luteus TaxID=1270 RepID=UPI00055A7407
VGGFGDGRRDPTRGEGGEGGPGGPRLVEGDALKAVYWKEAPGRPAPAVGTVEAACPAHEDDGGAARIA